MEPSNTHDEQASDAAASQMIQSTESKAQIMYENSGLSRY